MKSIVNIILYHIYLYEQSLYEFQLLRNMINEI